MQEKDSYGWPVGMPRYLVENPIRDLLDREVDPTRNILGNFWLERGTYGTILGSAGVGKSVLTVQIGVEAALGRNTFGIKVPESLKVLIVQAEDSRNDRITQTNGIVNNLDPAARGTERELIAANLRIVTPEARADRGAALFDYLRAGFRDVKLDLLILNPAFAFIDGNVNSVEPVGDFLRNHLQAFLREKNAAGLVIHHVPKPPKSGKGRGADTTVYSGHGSAEFANAPRASLTIERTMASWVFEFLIGKRGSYSGWTSDRDGDYRRYFTHSRSGGFFWGAAAEVDIAAANSGMGEEDFAEVFKGDADLTFEIIQRRFKHLRFPIKEEELLTLLENLVNRGKLTTTFIEGGPNDGQATWRAVKSVAVRETEGQRMDNVLFFIEEAGAKGINTTELRKLVPFGNAPLSNALVGLEKIGRIYSRPGKRNAIIY
jgi:AAA domain